MDSKQERIYTMVTELTELANDPQYREISKEFEIVKNALTRIAEFSPPQENEVSYCSADLFDYMPNQQGVTILRYLGFDEPEIILPDEINGMKLTSIGPRAFLNCKALKSIDLGENIISICKEAFAGCKALEKINPLPNLRYIGEKAFTGCVNLRSFFMPQSLKHIGKRAFYRSGIRTVAIPPKVQFLSYGTFEECAHLSDISLGSVSIIGNNCFSGCSDLQNISIPASVSYIGSKAFLDCYSLNNMYVYQKNIEWKDHALSYVQTYIPKGRRKEEIRYIPSMSVTVHCLPGYTAQLYCRENGIACKGLQNTVGTRETSTKPNFDHVVALTMGWTLDHKRADEALKTLYTFFSNREIVVDSKYDDNRLILYVLDNTLLDSDSWKDHIVTSLDLNDEYSSDNHALKNVYAEDIGSFIYNP